MVGGEIQGAEIVEIELKRVYINNRGHREYIDGEAGTGEVAYTPPPPVASSAPPASDVGQGVKELSANNYEIQRDEIDKALNNMGEIAMQARIVPAFKDGVSTGFKLFSIRPDSLYSKIGIQNGDVVRRINGFEINDPAKALELYAKLRDSNRIEIEVERNGASINKTYNVRN